MRRRKRDARALNQAGAGETILTGYRKKIIPQYGDRFSNDDLFPFSSSPGRPVPSPCSVRLRDLLARVSDLGGWFLGIARLVRPCLGFMSRLVRSFRLLALGHSRSPRGRFRPRRRSCPPAC